MRAIIYDKRVRRQGRATFARPLRPAESGFASDVRIHRPRRVAASPRALRAPARDGPRHYGPGAWPRFPAASSAACLRSDGLKPTIPTRFVADENLGGVLRPAGVDSASSEAVAPA